MNALMRLNQLKPGLQYKLVSQTGPVHVPVFTMAVEVDGTTFEASGPSKRTAKLHVAVKVRTPFTREILCPASNPATSICWRSLNHSESVWTPVGPPGHGPAHRSGLEDC